MLRKAAEEVVAVFYFTTRERVGAEAPPSTDRRSAAQAAVVPTNFRA
jgi:hypothetical protein